MQDVLMALQALKRESDSGNLFRTRSMQMPVAPAAADPQPQPPAQAPAAKGASKGLIAGIAAAVLLLGGGGFGYWKLKQKHDREQQETIAAAEKAQNDERARAAAAQAQAAQQATPPPDLGVTNDQIMELVANKVPESVILGHIKSAPKTTFTLSTDDILKLSKAGVSARLIEAMRDPKKIADTSVAQANPQQAAILKQAAAKVSAPAKQEVIPAPPPIAAAPQPVAETKPLPPPTVTPAPTPVVPTTRPVAIPDGTPFNIAITADVPNDVAEGTSLKFVIEQEVKIDGAVVLAKGAPVSAVVIDATKKAKFAGLGGKKATFRPLTTVSIEGKSIRLRATPAKGLTESSLEAQGKKAPKDMVAGAGTTYIAYIDGEQTVNVKK
jgi:serine/threonine-protein kinase